MNFDKRIDELLGWAEEARATGRYAELDRLLARIDLLRQMKIDYQQRQGVTTCPHCGCPDAHFDRQLDENICSDCFRRWEGEFPETPAA